jgi:hypothetical protein
VEPGAVAVAAVGPVLATVDSLDDCRVERLL